VPIVNRQELLKDMTLRADASLRQLRRETSHLEEQERDSTIMQDART
jgi:hypothetical protein